MSGTVERCLHDPYGSKKARKTSHKLPIGTSDDNQSSTTKKHGKTREPRRHEGMHISLPCVQSHVRVPEPFLSVFRVSSKPITSNLVLSTPNWCSGTKPHLLHDSCDCLGHIALQQLETSAIEGAASWLYAFQHAMQHQSQDFVVRKSTRTVVVSFVAPATSTLCKNFDHTVSAHVSFLSSICERSILLVFVKGTTHLRSMHRRWCQPWIIFSSHFPWPPSSSQPRFPRLRPALKALLLLLRFAFVHFATPRWPCARLLQLSSWSPRPRRSCDFAWDRRRGLPPPSASPSTSCACLRRRLATTASLRHVKHEHFCEESTGMEWCWCQHPRWISMDTPHVYYRVHVHLHQQKKK